MAISLLDKNFKKIKLTTANSTLIFRFTKYAMLYIKKNGIEANCSLGLKLIKAF